MSALERVLGSRRIEVVRCVAQIAFFAVTSPWYSFTSVPQSYYMLPTFSMVG
jgi:hypothetical protein